jgi:hypothetical protein
MRDLSPSIGFRKARRVFRRSNIWVVTLAGIALILLVFFAIKGSRANLFIVISSVPFLAALVARSPRAMIYSLIVWAALLGLFRRLSDSYFTSGSFGDPLLLVLPIVLVLLFIVALHRGAFEQRTPLAKIVLFVTVLAVVECFNPLQGGVNVGLGALLLVVAPLLAFWVGRVLMDERTVYRALWLVAGLALACAIYGISQTLFGLTFWDQRWVTHVLSSYSYAAISVGGVTRGFGTFSSSQEYAAFLGIGLISWCALGRLRAGHMGLTLVAVAIIGWAIIVDSSRGILILSVLAVGVMFAVRAGMRLRGVVLSALVAFVSLTLVAGHVGSNGGTSANSVLLQHQFQGLANPLNPQDSTLLVHWSVFLRGIGSAFTMPIGHGTGSVTVAASHFAGNSLGTDLDPSNAAVAFGLIGLVAYIVLITRAFSLTYEMAGDRQSPVHLAVLGILAVTFLQWLNGGLYSVDWLIWLCLGWMDGQHLRMIKSQPLDSSDQVNRSLVARASNGRW